ncbi:MAG: FIG061771: ATP-dependent nuclease subunit A, partial [uncultured Craurococcus sp.]
ARAPAAVAGRALRRAGRADAHPHARPGAGAVARPRPDHADRHPRRRRGRAAGRPRAGARLQDQPPAARDARGGRAALPPADGGLPGGAAPGLPRPGGGLRARLDLWRAADAAAGRAARCASPRVRGI